MKRSGTVIAGEAFFIFVVVGYLRYICYILFVGLFICCLFFFVFRLWPLHNKIDDERVAAALYSFVWGKKKYINIELLKFESRVCVCEGSAH